MELFKLVLSSEIKKLHKNGVRLKVIGDLSAFDDGLVKKIKAAETLTENNTELNLNIAANYGGRWDITQAAKLIAQDVAKGNLLADDVDESVFDSYTCFAQLPDLDLLIRTGGEQRISNFLLWQSAYAEFYFTDILWPDFNEQVFTDAISAYNERQRRFGKISEQIT
jgi:undecaprenyl diphosphate synthase